MGNNKNANITLLVFNNCLYNLNCTYTEEKNDGCILQQRFVIFYYDVNKIYLDCAQ